MAAFHQGTGTLVPGSGQTRPYWFNGRFLAAEDLARDQRYFLTGQQRLGTSAGFGVIHGLQVSMPTGQGANPETIVIAAGQGLTPGGDLVMIPNDLTINISDLADDEDLDVQFGISGLPVPLPRTRTGVFAIALRPVEFTANPITAYPVTIQGTRTTHDGNVVEATAVSLVPWPEPPGSYDPATEQAALARSIFLDPDITAISGSFLPVAMVSLQRDVIEWVDQWLLRRESGPEPNDLRLSLSQPAAQQAWLLQYDAQLLYILQRTAGVRFAASDYFQALPPAGRFPITAIDTDFLTQFFFPPQTDVLLSLVPSDELPALIEDSLSLAPLDLTQAASSYADIAVSVLIPVARENFAALAATLRPVQLKGALPQVLNNRKPLELLKFFPPLLLPVVPVNWQAAIGSQTYAYYVRRRSVPLFAEPSTVAFVAVPGAATGVFTLTASVSPQTATGTVTFVEGETVLGTATLAQGSGSLSVTLTSGIHQLRSAYSGDAYFAGSSSAPLVQTV